LKERDVEREGDSWRGNDGTKAILEIRAKGSGTCGPRARSGEARKKYEKSGRILKGGVTSHREDYKVPGVHAGCVDPPDDFQSAVYGTH